jgi:HEAT repeat protein
MTTPAGILSDFAGVLLLLRDHPERKEELKHAFHRFVADLPDANHVLRVTPGGLAWDQIEVPVGRGELATLHDHLRGHNIGEIRLPAALMTSTLLSVFRILGAPVGTYGSFDHLSARLDAAGCGIVTILPLPEGTRGASAVVPAPAPDGPRARGEDDGHINALGLDALTEAKVGMMHFATLQTHALGPTDSLMDGLAHSNSESATTALLNQLITAGEAAARQSEWREVLKAAYGLVQLEGKNAPGAEPRTFGIALRRMLPRSALERIARLAAQGNMKAEAIAVLRRMGADSTEVLLNALVNSEDVTERRAYFNALKEMTEGGDLLIHMLSHDQWFVVRNVADLCGELRLEKAVPALARQMGHDDERVRRAVAGGLARIGGAGALEALRRALRDPVPGVRLQAAKDLDGRKSRGLAMTLAVAAEEESKSDVQKEMYLALGRIASTDAIQALRKAAEPGGRLFRRKPLSVRLAAVAGLHAAGPSAANALKELLTDDEREIREAVERSLSTLWE